MTVYTSKDRHLTVRFGDDDEVSVAFLQRRYQGSIRKLIETPRYPVGHPLEGWEDQLRDDFRAAAELHERNTREAAELDDRNARVHDEASKPADEKTRIPWGELGIHGPDEISTEDRSRIVLRGTVDVPVAYGRALRCTVLLDQSDRTVRIREVLRLVGV